MTINRRLHTAGSMMGPQTVGHAPSKPALTIGRLATFLSALISNWALYYNVALAQVYPEKPVRLIVAGPAGGAPDIVARIYAERLSQGLGQQLVVDNRPGVGGSLALQVAAKSLADGYTLLLATQSGLACSPSLYRNVGYDPVKSFEPISQLTRATAVVIVTSSISIKSLKDLISLAKSKPGELRFGSNGNGGALHIAGEMFKTSAGVDLFHVPYKGGPAAIPDLIANRIQLIFEQPAAYLPHIRSGTLRALAVAGPARLAQLPDVPTASEAGLPGYEVTGFFALLAPKGTSADVIKRLNAEVIRAAAAKEVQNKIAAQGVDLVSSSPTALAALIVESIARCSHTIKAAGIKLD